MTRGLLSLLAAVLLMGIPAIGQAKTGRKVTVLNASRVYHPTVFNAKKLYKKICVVDSRAIFDATKEYKQIKKRKISKNTAEYRLLIKKASDCFKRAVRKTAAGGSYEVIAEAGAISVKGSQPKDITQEVILNLQ